MSVPKLKICNREITRETAAMTGETERLVRDITDFTFEFTHDRIKDGAFESVYLRKFGKFSARPHIVKAIQDSNGDKALRKTIKAELKRQSLLNLQPPDETIHDISGLHLGAEQGVDPHDPGLCDDPAQGQGE